MCLMQGSFWLGPLHFSAMARVTYVIFTNPSTTKTKGVEKLKLVSIYPQVGVFDVPIFCFKIKRLGYGYTALCALACFWFVISTK